MTDYNAIQVASDWIARLQGRLRDEGLDFMPPHVSGTAEEAVIEWWRDPRAIAVLIAADETGVLCVWGTGDVIKMAAAVDTDMVRAWRWLLSGDDSPFRSEP